MPEHDHHDHTAGFCPHLAELLPEGQQYIRDLFVFDLKLEAGKPVAINGKQCTMLAIVFATLAHHERFKQGGDRERCNNLMLLAEGLAERSHLEWLLVNCPTQLSEAFFGEESPIVEGVVQVQQMFEDAEQREGKH